MKKSTFLIILSLGILISSCSKDDDDIQEIKPLQTQNYANKMVVQTLNTSVATGFNTMFAEWYTDSLSRTEFCRDFTHHSMFMEDASGYVFVETYQAYNIAHPAKPELEGTSTIGQTDAYGKKIVEQMIDIAQYIGFGFLEYYLENQVSGEIEKKTTFIKSIPEASWYSGAGFYHGPNEPFLTSDQVNQKIVKESVSAMAGGLGAVLENYAADSLQGVAMMQSFLQHIRFFDDQSGYFYVIDFSGYNVVQPPDPDFQGTYEYDFQDSQGNYLVRGLIETAKNGGGFYSYYWIDYQTGEEKLKTAFVKQIPGKDYLIGSGIYTGN